MHYIKVMKNVCFLKDPEKIEQIENITIEKFKQFETEILESIHCTLVDTYDSAILSSRQFLIPCVQCGLQQSGVEQKTRHLKTS